MKSKIFPWGVRVFYVRKVVSENISMSFDLYYEELKADKESFTHRHLPFFLDELRFFFSHCNLGGTLAVSLFLVQICDHYFSNQGTCN